MLEIVTVQRRAGSHCDPGSVLIEKRAAGMRRRCEKSESYEKDREYREGREEDIDILSERGEHELISLD